MISVVIPYYQRQPGVLRRALASVWAQQDCGMPVQVIVIDDGSPVSASSELDGWNAQSGSVKILNQTNAGPGAARNAGLERVGQSTRYVAFLDSDDEWSPDHLARAVHALECGFDFYFADLYQLDQTVGAFARGGRLDPAHHPNIGAPVPKLHAYQGDMFDQIVRGNVIGTPTVVYRLDKAPKARFRTDLTTAGEDYLFWMTLAKAGLRIAFSSQIATTCGRGVNVYSGALWASDEYFVRLRHELSYRKATRQLFEVNADQETHLQRSIAGLRESFAAALLHRYRHRQGLAASLLKAHWRADPRSYLVIPSTGVRMMIGRK